MDLEMAGKAVLITGGTDGLGLALARQLVVEGASVGICGRNEDRLRAAEEGLRAAGGDVLAQRADVSRLEDIEAFVEAAVARWGRIDGVVHNAGRASAGPLESIDDATWDGDFQLKLMAAVRLTRLALPGCGSAQGSVLFTLAMAAKAPGAGQRAELGHPGGRYGAHEIALQGAGARRRPGQRRAHRSHRERAVGPRRRRLWRRARGVLRALRQGRRHPARPIRARRRSSPTWDASCCRPGRPTSPGRRSTSTGGCRRPSEGYTL